MIPSYNYRNTSVMLTIAVLLLLGCHKRYWDRRVGAPQKPRQSIRVVIDNKVPYVFKDGFTTVLKKTCEKEFEDMGYSTIYKDSPHFIANITIDMDSFPVKGVYVLGKGGPTYFWQAYKKTKVYALLFDYKISYLKGGAIKWEEHNDIYYFDDVFKNSRRANNMIKYTIRYGK
jgi:hypothetical protein